ncbi:MAG: hypothetical protein IH937_03345 [Acidobacteria bacterium]|nr:hypothetical protein [Acidobacteriota bacterium]
MLTDGQIGVIVEAEEADAEDLATDIAKKREALLDGYSQRPYGDEVKGQSSVVTSDISDVVESLLPSLMRVYAQGKQVGKFTASDPEADDEAEQKTLYANWVFFESNPGLKILHSVFKDALLQFTGTCKVWWDESEEVTEERYTGMSQEQILKLKLEPETEILDTERDEAGPDAELQPETFTVKVKRTTKTGIARLTPIPPEQTRIAKNAADFVKPRFIGQKTPKTRSELILMGFNKKKVNGLPAHDQKTSPVETARNYDLNRSQDDNPTVVKANDVIMLGEYYMYIDVDEDGVSELWQIFYAGTEVLDKTRVDEHPYAVCVPIPMPHRAIGTCPAEQVADIQLIKSTLVRHTLNNAYLINYARTLVNERVDLDDILAPPTPGQTIRIKGDEPIAGSVEPMVVQPQIPDLLQAVEYVDTMRENRTGITRFNQGLDADTLNQTATGFKGLMGASQQREQLIALMMSDGIKTLFNKIIALAHKHQSAETQIRVTGEVMNINPSGWRYKMDCAVQVGIGSGDRQEKISNLNYILQQQKELMLQRSTVSDQSKMYNTLDKLVTEVGLKDVDLYFNDPSKPQETLQSENEQMIQMIEQLQAQIEQQGNQIAEAALIEQQGKLALGKAQLELDVEKLKIDTFNKTEDRKFKYTDLETKENVDIPGEGVEVENASTEELIRLASE